MKQGLFWLTAAVSTLLLGCSGEKEQATAEPRPEATLQAGNRKSVEELKTEVPKAPEEAAKPVSLPDPSPEASKPVVAVKAPVEAVSPEKTASSVPLAPVPVPEAPASKEEEAVKKVASAVKEIAAQEGRIEISEAASLVKDKVGNRGEELSKKAEEFLESEEGAAVGALLGDLKKVAKDDEAKDRAVELGKKVAKEIDVDRLKEGLKDDPDAVKEELKSVLGDLLREANKKK